MEFVLLVFVEDDPKSTNEGMAMEVADFGGALVRKNDEDENGSYTELSTAVCIADSRVTILSS
jgi:hypothetical protein